MKYWKKPLGWFSKFVVLINFIAIIILLLSYLSPHLNPQIFWPIAFFGMAYPFLLFINCGFVIYWLYRKPPMAIMSIISILLGWSQLTSNIGFNLKTEPQINDSSSIRVMSYNVHLFKSFEVKKGLDKKPDHINLSTKTEILQIFTDIKPDVICIQEFYSRKKGKDDIHGAIIKSLGYTHHYFQPVAANDFDAYGIAIYSKYPILKSGTIPISNQERSVNRIQYVDVKKEGKPFRIYNVHLQSVGFQKEDYAFINNKFSNMDDDISSTKRIGSRLRDAFIKRSKQVEVLSEHIKTCNTPYIVAGDFNDTPSSYSVNKIAKLANNAFKSKSSGLGITYNGDFPNFQIDYIMASKEFTIRNYHIISERYSDHYPIWCDLEL